MTTNQWYSIRFKGRHLPYYVQCLGVAGPQVHLHSAALGHRSGKGEWYYKTEFTIISGDIDEQTNRSTS